MRILCQQCQRSLEFSGDRPSFCAYCGQRLAGEDAAPTLELPGRSPTPVFTGGSPVRDDLPSSIGGCRLLRRIGGGGMGSVYEAQEVSSGRHVAVKLISPQFVTSPDAVHRFRQEGRLAGMISHPRCVFVMRADEEAGLPYIVMELMPGKTLQDLVAEEGPLDPDRAIRLMLDVIEGLREAHELGVLHRDVKPSNCFLDDEGRVKVGDFGLSKSLMTNQDLTQSGRFLGTLLYASPEQLLAQPLDVRSDVYCVASTLFYLLTGRAPFQSDDTVLSVTRSVSERAPRIRSLRPELSAALDAVIAKGLERDIARRWQNLDQLANALTDCLNQPQPVAGLRVRFVAFLIDGLLTFGWALLTESSVLADLTGASVRASTVLSALLNCLMFLGYFGILETRWGGSVGKLLLRLRVRSLDTATRALPRQILARTAICYLLGTFAWDAGAAASGFLPDGQNWFELFSFVGFLVGNGVLLGSLVVTRGKAMAHDLLTGTRVVQLPWPERRLVLRSKPPALPPPKNGQVNRIPPFVIAGEQAIDSQRALLWADDPLLGRRILLHVRPASEPAVEMARRQINRPTRLRWLSEGVSGGERWDAYIAPQGFPLASFLASRRRLDWRSLRALLVSLTQELVEASRDGTLPQRISGSRIWVSPSGRVQLLEYSGTEEKADEFIDLRGSNQSEFLMQIGAALQSVAGPLPDYARRLLNSLAAGRYQSLTEWQADLEATRHLPAEVTSTMRLARILLLSAGLFPWLALSLYLGTAINGLLVTFLVDEVERNRVAVAVLEDAPEEFIKQQIPEDSTVPLEIPVLIRGKLYDQISRKEALSLIQDRGAMTARLHSRTTTGTWELRQRQRPVSLIDRIIWFAAYSDARRVLDNPAQSPERTSIADLLSAVSETPPPGISFSRLVSMGIRFAMNAQLAGFLLLVAWSFAFRGGLTLAMVGLTLAQYDGRVAARWRCALRTFFAWLPFTSLLYFSAWLQLHRPTDAHFAGGLSLLAVAYVVACFAWCVWRPGRAWYDQVARTEVLPQ